MHELDRVIWPGEPDVVEPTRPASSASLITQAVQEWMNETDARFSSEDRLLALAAGQAYPELKIAESLGLTHSSITLVDRGFTLRAMARLQRDYPKVEVIESGMFSFLENPSKDDFSVATLIGIEYAFEVSGAIETLIELLPNVLRRNGIVVVFPCTIKNPEQEWIRHNFQPLFPWTTKSVLLYQYKGKNLQ